jgi:hypothetical protein
MVLPGGNVVRQYGWIEAEGERKCRLARRFFLISGARDQQRARGTVKRDGALALVERFLTEPVD